MFLRFDPLRAFDRVAEERPGTGRGGQIPLDAYRRGNEFTLRLDLPGVDPGSIGLTVEADVLTVRAARRWIPAEGDELQVTERPQGEFSRQLLLGESLDRDHISAAYGDGVLTITIPVVEQAKPHKVEVTRAGAAAQALKTAAA